MGKAGWVLLTQGGYQIGMQKGIGVAIGIGPDLLRLKPRLMEVSWIAQVPKPEPSTWTLTFHLQNHVLFLLQSCLVVSQNSSLLVSEPSLVSHFLGPRSQMQPSPGILTGMTQSLPKLSFGSIPWQSRGGEVQREYRNPSEIPLSSSGCGTKADQPGRWEIWVPPQPLPPLPV